MRYSNEQEPSLLDLLPERREEGWGGRVTLVKGAGRFLTQNQKTSARSTHPQPDSSERGVLFLHSPRAPQPFTRVLLSRTVHPFPVTNYSFFGDQLVFFPTMVKHECPYDGCEFSAKYKSKLTRHLRGHTGERPFECPYEGCTYAASQKGNLTTHERSHTKERPYPCPYEGCTYAASKTSTLRDHERTHTRVRPFVCPFPKCTYAAISSSALSNHRRRKHK